MARERAPCAYTRPQSSWESDGKRLTQRLYFCIELFVHVRCLPCFFPLELFGLLVVPALDVSKGRKPAQDAVVRCDSAGGQQRMLCELAMATTLIVLMCIFPRFREQMSSKTDSSDVYDAWARLCSFARCRFDRRCLFSLPPL